MTDADETDALAPAFLTEAQAAQVSQRIWSTSFI